MKNMNTDMREENAFFAAANTADGFVSFFEEIFFGEKIRRRYIIKGGPGTGKSSFMRRAALHAASLGKDVEYYYCSSDTDSLDGIIIDGSVAIFDGTAPHCYDTVLPGARDEIVNLGEFWDSAALELSADEIANIGRQKKAAYAHAYGYLAAAGEVARTLSDTVLPCVRLEKLRGAVGRIFEKLPPPEDNGSAIVRQVSAFGVKGQIRLDTLRRMASRIHCVDDHYGSGYIFLSELMDTAKKQGYTVYVSFDTVLPTRPTEIYLPETGDCFILSDADTPISPDAHHINMKRFVDLDALAAIRSSYRAAKQAYRTLCDLALHELSLAGTAHSTLESHYTKSMNFCRLQRFCDKFIEGL